MSPHLKCRKSIKKTKASRRSKRGGFKVRVSHINLALIVLVVFTLGTYLTQVVSSTTIGFQMRETDNKLGEYTRTTKELEAKINSYKSVNYIAQSAQELGMVSPRSIAHLSPISTSFASR